MKLVVCAVFDVKSGAYSNPQYFRSNGEAIRAFVDSCNDERSNLSRHASDYSFWKLAVFDDASGEFKSEAVKLLEGVEALSQHHA